MRLADGTHLTYCLNVHPGEGWAEVRRAIETAVPAVKERVAADRPFGVGLYLSAASAAELRGPAAVAALSELLAARNLYAFTVNAFPFGAFHGTRVKEAVYRPHWGEDMRLAHANRVAEVLAAVLPADVEGSVSTVPGAFAPDAAAPGALERIVDNLIRHAAHLAELRERTGRTVALALEPEPGCLLETAADARRFFAEHLFTAAAAARLAELAGMPTGTADEALRRHLGLCLDLCHAAVAFEDPEAMLDELAAEGIPVAKMQVTAGLRLDAADAEALALLRPFVDSPYLHQVVARRPGGLAHFLDLDQAFTARRDDWEWRVHLHVPVFLAAFGRLASTQDFVRAVLARQRRRPVARHLEVETYTWQVLPESWRGGGLEDAIAREVAWVRGQLEGAP